MNDENTETQGAAASPRKRTVAVAAAVGVAGLLAGGLAAGALSAASADTGSTGARSGYGVPRGYGGPGDGQDADPSKPMRSDEKLLTGTTKEKVLAAVKAKYPDATVQRVETDSDGVYEAHILDDGQPLTVLVGKSFTITGTEAGGPGGHGGPDGPGGHGPGSPGGAEGQPPTAPDSSGGSASEDSSYRQS